MTDLSIEEKQEILKHITVGTDEVFYHPYSNGQEPLPLRPLTSSEFDECFYKALENAPNGVAKFVIKIKLSLIKESQEIEVDEENLTKLQRFYDEVDYWIVYHAMKDFQPEAFRTPNYDKIESFPNGYYIVRNDMREIHEIAKRVLDYSHQPQQVLKEIFYDDLGTQLAMKVTYLHQPLNKISQLTKLQEDFLIYSNAHLREVLKGKAKQEHIIRSDTPMKIKEILRKL